MMRAKDREAFYMPRIECSRYTLRAVREGSPREWPATSGAPAAFEFLRPFYLGLTQETLSGLYLDTRNVPIGWAVIAVGTVNTATATPRDVFAPAFALNATGVVLAHNHPSGDVTPSGADVTFTKELGKSATILGISLHDHLVITDDAYTSMRERGLL